MPKKRHQSAFSKPPSTAPTSLRSSGLHTNLHHHEVPQSRAVNDLLVKMRNAALLSEVAPGGANGHPSHHGDSSYPLVAPSMPPEVARILHPREHPNDALGGGLRCGGASGRPVRRAAGFRRPAGPAPPPSWLAQSMHAPPSYGSSSSSSSSMQEDGRRREQPPVPSAPFSRAVRGRISLPGVTPPAHGSLVDMALHAVAGDWATVVQVTGETDVLELGGLPGALKAALVSHLSALWWVGKAKGTSVADLRLLLQSPSASATNEEVHYLDLTAAIGDSITISEVASLLFPRRPRGRPHGRRRSSAAIATATAAAAAAAAARPSVEPPLPESWDDPDAALAAVPRALLPSLTHLSFALAPGQDRSRDTHRPPPPVSWHQLLDLAEHLPTLTHLDLSYWPEPALTPTTRFSTAAAADPEGDDSLAAVDWEEAQRLLQRLSHALYGLVFLDLTGCARWAAALYSMRDGQGVDWVRDWSRMTTVVLRRGAATPVPGATCDSETVARSMERTIRSRRQGQGRFITVVCDDEDGRLD